MDIWTLVILGGIGFLVLSYLGKNIPSFDMPDIPFMGDNNSTDQETEPSQPLPSPIQKAIDTLEEKYNIPLWLLVLAFIVVIWIAKR